MCTVNMTFEVPETMHINIDALKHQMNEFFRVLISTPTIVQSETIKDIDEQHIFDCFDNGGWAEDPRSAHEIAEELYNGRLNDRPIIEPYSLHYL